MTDWQVIGNMRGPQGEPGEDGEHGQAATIEVGDVSTVAPDEPATVVNVGDQTAAVFDFEIPQGIKGDPGSGGGGGGYVPDVPRAAGFWCHLHGGAVHQSNLAIEGNMWDVAPCDLVAPLTVDAVAVLGTGAASGGTQTCTVAVYVADARGIPAGSPILVSDPIDVVGAATGLLIATLTAPVTLPAGRLGVAVGQVATGQTTARPLATWSVGRDGRVAVPQANFGTATNVTCWRVQNVTVPDPLDVTPPSGVTVAANARIVYFRQAAGGP